MAKNDGVRVLRVARAVYESLVRATQSKTFWEIDGYITLTRVRMSKDLKFAKVGVRLMTTDPLKAADHDKAAEILNKLAYDLQAHLAKDIKLRFTPKLDFVVDHDWDQMIKVENELRNGGQS